MTVLIGSLTPLSTRTDTADPAGRQLVGAFGVHTLTLEQRTFVYVSGRLDSGVSVFELSADGSLSYVQDIHDNAALELEGAASITSITTAQGTFLYVNGSKDNGISVFQVDPATGTLSSRQNVVDTATLELSGAEGKAAVTTLGGKTYLVCSGDDDNGISVLEVGADGRLSPTSANVTDNLTLELDNALDVVTATLDGQTFVCVAGQDDNGVAVFELGLNSAGAVTLISTTNINDDATLNLGGAAGLAAATVDGASYLIASGGSDDGLSVFSISSTGQLTNVCNVSDTATRGLNGAQGLTTFTMDGETFVSVSGRDDDALSTFHLGATGQLSDVTAIFDTAETALDNSLYNTFVTLAGRPMLLATGYLDNGLTVFDIGSGDDVLTGTEVADLLLGLAGNDTLNGAGGDDRLIGGSGDDTYQVDTAGDQVVEQSGGGADTVQVAFSYTLGAHVENLRLTGTGAASGTGNALANVLTGNTGANLLDGGRGADSMSGGAGDDTYVVEEAGDTVTELAGGGTDTVRASISTTLADNVENLVLRGTAAVDGTGNGLDNQITGNAGANVLQGLSGRDTLLGLGGTDDLDGGQGNDRLAGGKGADTLLGGKGRDALEGNGGADDFVFTSLKDSGTTKATRDTIEDFRGNKDGIVLTRIDAVTGERGNQAFELDTDGDFDAGEIRFRETRAGVIVEMNVDADTRAEMSILIRGSGTLDVNDFLC